MLVIFGIWVNFVENGISSGSVLFAGIPFQMLLGSKKSEWYHFLSAYVNISKSTSSINFC